MNVETDVAVKEILEQTGFDLIFRQSSRKTEAERNKDARNVGLEERKT